MAHTEISNKVLKWKDCGTYKQTVCGQYYAYKESGLWQGGRVMFGRDIDYRVSFPNLESVKSFLQEQERNKVIIVGDPLHPVYAEGGLLHRKMLGM
jgi:hypothetical protein